MALDLQKVRNDIYNASMTINKMQSLVDAALTGKFSVEEVEVTFTQPQKDAMVAKYLTLKGDLVSLISGLP